MDRIPEPELMNDPAQAKAYAEADFTEPHNAFVDLFRQKTGIGEEEQKRVLDLGCGPADITVRMARAYPGFHFHGIDGSAAMLREGEKRVTAENLADRISLFQGTLPEFVPPFDHYDLIISNSLLHHLYRPAVLWDYVKSFAAENSRLFVMDLARPASKALAQELVNTYSHSEPEILQRDFYNSLCAAFTVEEVRGQLQAAGLGEVDVEAISDRHLLVHGIL